MEQGEKTRMIKALTILSIFLAISGMVAIVSAFPCPPNQFYGTVMINGEDAPAGTIITAYIDDELRGSIEIGTAGEYGYDLNYLGVTGSESDNGRTIVFKVAEVLANENAAWNWYAVPRRLDLTIGDCEAPVVSDPSANPPSISVDGIQTSQLNVTVTDNGAVGIVTVDLSEIGGPEARVMEYIGDDVYSTTTNASVDTATGTYCLPVHASDIVGNYDDSVCITLAISDWKDEWMGPESDGGAAVTDSELREAANCWLDGTPVRGHVLTTADFQLILAAWLSDSGAYE
jgi:hypothetical protein